MGFGLRSAAAGLSACDRDYVDPREVLFADDRVSLETPARQLGPSAGFYWTKAGPA